MTTLVTPSSRPFEDRAYPAVVAGIRTWNDTLNAPMLAINTALGVVRQLAWITYGRTL